MRGFPGTRLDPKQLPERMIAAGKRVKRKTGLGFCGVAGYE